MQNLNLLVAFGAGVLTFISPCTLPIYPAFLSYITGVSVKDLKEKIESMFATSFDYRVIAESSQRRYNAENYYNQIVEIYK